MGCTSSRSLNVADGSSSNQSRRRQRNGDVNTTNTHQRNNPPPAHLLTVPMPSVGFNDSWMRAHHHGHPFADIFSEEEILGRRHRRGIFRRNNRPPRAASREIMELQQSLEAMEWFFQTLLGQSSILMEAMDPNSGAGAGPPPASETEMSRLKRSALQKHELKGTHDGGNNSSKLCAICCEPYTVGEIVTRLPCSHFFHPHCVEPWLHRHCTCPTCRYELATDDDDYEQGRIERMKSRKNIIIKEGQTPLNACSTEDLSDECPSDEEVAPFKAWWDNTSPHQADHDDDLLVIDETGLESSGFYSDEDSSLYEYMSLPKESEMEHETFFRSQSTGSLCGDEAVSQATTGRERTASIALGDCCTSEDGAALTEPAEVLLADGSLAQIDTR